MSPSCNPANGGCWFCQKKDGDMVFSFEWDSYLHLECLELAMLTNPDNWEIVVFKKEFGYAE